jgi:hypothetical protein
MAQEAKENHLFFLLFVGLFAWLIPGGGHLVIKEKTHAIIIFVTIALTFFAGLCIGSIGVIDSISSKPWYYAQILNSPVVLILGILTKSGNYPVFGRPAEIGQIYTSIAGLLNLLCIVNAVYWAHLRRTGRTGEQN